MKIEGLRGRSEGTRILRFYKHYRGENLPDQQFFDNALVDTFHLPQEKVSEFKAIFLETLENGKTSGRTQWEISEFSMCRKTRPIDRTARIL